MHLGMHRVKGLGDAGGKRCRELTGQVHWLIVHTGVTRRITSYADEMSPSAPKWASTPPSLGTSLPQRAGQSPPCGGDAVRSERQ